MVFIENAIWVSLLILIFIAIGVLVFSDSPFLMQRTMQNP